MRLYNHGAGRTGRQAWPQQGDKGAVFVEFAPGDSFEEHIQCLAGLSLGEPVDVVAHSLGGVTAILALDCGIIQAKRLVLLEPALYDLARGNRHVEDHIRILSRAHELRATGDLYGFWEMIRPVFFGAPPRPDDREEDQAAARHFASIPVPWGHGITSEMIPARRTTVVTGNWNPEYEAIAASISSLGGRHLHLTGTAHRPQDHEHFERQVFGA